MRLPFSRSGSKSLKSGSGEAKVLSPLSNEESNLANKENLGDTGRSEPKNGMFGFFSKSQTEKRTKESDQAGDCFVTE